MNKNVIDISINTTWKLFYELLMYLIKPVVLLYLWVNGVKIGNNSKFYGFPRIYRHRKSSILIGDNFESRNWMFSNPLGINHPLILCTWSEGSKILIGDNVGISGGSIVASTKIEIGEGTIIGANTTIVDTDFHPIKSLNRRYDIEDIKSFPVKIGKNVFIGMNSTILKGITLADNSIVPAGEIVRHRK
jgi:acetyltransferase-like isoleucine patch superfamily enzyme